MRNRIRRSLFTACQAGGLLVLMAGLAHAEKATDHKKSADKKAEKKTAKKTGATIAADTAASKAAEQQPAAQQYAGMDTCQVCHEDIVKAFATQPHNELSTDKRRGSAGHACETCHGPGQKHAESADASLIRNPAKLDPGAVDKVCMSCHLNEQTHVGRLESSHAKNQVSCLACHKVHSDQIVAKTPTQINTQCSGCHAGVWAQFQRPQHHKLPEGAMSCVDCHNPHGTIRPAMTQVFAANEPGCLNCHGDKRGPFTFEHAPVRYDGCTACHEPHGSANPRLLNRAEVRYTCLECHAALPTMPGVAAANSTIGVVPPSFHDLRSPIYQNCTVCHQKVHGSYVDRNLLR